MVDFIVLGPITVMGYKDIYPMLLSKKIMIGSYRLTPYKEVRKWFNYNGKLVEQACVFFQNIKKFETPNIPIRKYIAEDYKTFENEEYHNYINVNYISEIPDYDGIMGVPLQGYFLKCNDSQFEIIKLINDGIVDGSNVYFRLLIRRRQ